MKITRQGHNAIIDLEGITRMMLTPSELKAKAQQMLALADTLENLPPMVPKFDEVSCSQCGRTFGPGDYGFSRCKDHAYLANPVILDGHRPGWR